MKLQRFVAATSVIVAVVFVGVGFGADVDVVLKHKLSGLSLVLLDVLLVVDGVDGGLARFAFSVVFPINEPAGGDIVEASERVTNVVSIVVVIMLSLLTLIPLLGLIFF